MLRKLFHIPQPNTNCVCWWHFFFPPKKLLYLDAATYCGEWNGGRKVTHTYYTFRSFIHGFFANWLWEIKRYWRIRGIDAKLIFQLGIVSFDNSGSGQTTTGTTVTVSHTTAVGAYMICGTAVDNGTISGVTYNLVSLTNEGTATQVSRKATIWSISNPASGINDAVATHDTNNVGRGLGIVTATGALSTNGFATNTGTTNPANVTVTGSNGSMILACSAATGVSNIGSVGDGQTLRWNLNVPGYVWLGGSTMPRIDPAAREMDHTHDVGGSWAMAGINLVGVPVSSATLPFIGAG